MEKRMINVAYDKDTKKVIGFYDSEAKYDNPPEYFIQVPEGEEHMKLVEMANSGQELYVKDTESMEFALRDIVLTESEINKRKYDSLKLELAKIKEDIEQENFGIIRDDYAEKKARAAEIINELRALEGKEPREVAE